MGTSGLDWTEQIDFNWVVTRVFQMRGLNRGCPALTVCSDA